MEKITEKEVNSSSSVDSTFKANSLSNGNCFGITPSEVIGETEGEVIGDTTIINANTISEDMLILSNTQFNEFIQMFASCNYITTPFF